MRHKKNRKVGRLLTFAIAILMSLSALSMISVTVRGQPVVDGVISPGEYAGGMHIVLEGPWDSPSSPYDGPLDGYLYWDAQYLWIAVNEPVPEWLVPPTYGGGSFIEFMWDAGIHGTLPYYHAWVLFSDGNWQYVRCGKPSGCWGWAADPFPGHSWWATGTATEFKFDYTDYGTQYGDTIKLIVDSADRSASPLTFGNCQVWPYVSPSNPDYYPCETPASVATWGDVHLNGAPPPPPPGHVVDGVIGASEYAGGMAVELVGKTDPTWKVDAYIDWDSTFLYVAVDEGVPNFPGGGGLDWIEFTIDPGATWPTVHAFAMFGSGSTHSTQSTKPSGSWGVVPHPFTAASAVATEFSVDYTAFGIALGDTIKMSIDRNDASAPTPPPHYTYGFAAFWPAGANVYDGPPGTAPDPTTWADVTLSGGGPPPPPTHIVDGVITPGEYDGGMAVELKEASWTVDGYIDWDDQYLYVVVDEPCPPANWIEFAFDAGSARDRWDLYYTTGAATGYQECMKPGGAWTTTASPAPFTISSSTATEFKADYTAFGIALGDTIQMCLERGATPNAFWPEGGIIWQNPPRTPDPTTWGDVTLTAPLLNIPPVADANGPYYGEIGESIHLDGSGSDDPDGTIVSYEWDLDDDGLYDDATGMNPTYSWSTAGIHPIELKVTDNDGATDIDDTTVEINAPPIADFTYSPLAPTDLDLIQFTDTSSDADGTITSWAWDFDDGDTSTIQNPTHQYADDGTYHVMLTVTDDDGASDSITKDVIVSNVKPTADFTYTPADPTDLDVITFNDTSTDADGTIASWDWDFDDGNTSTLQNFTHQYADDGTYHVTLTVTDDDGASDSITTVVVVSNVDPTADADGPYHGTTDYPVEFDGSGSNDPDGVIASYEWDFGDSNTGLGEKPTHQYDNPGIYTVTLLVTDDDGSTDVDETLVVINKGAPPTTQILYPADGDVVKGTITVKWYAHDIMDGDTLPIYIYFKDVDDTLYSAFTGNPYPNTGMCQWVTTTLPDGTYKLLIEAIDSEANIGLDTSTFEIKNHEQPPTNDPPAKPSQPSGQTDGKIGQEYQYSTSTTDPDGDQMYYFWDWGDGNNSGWLGPYNSGATGIAKHSWQTKNNYNIKVKAKDIYGKESSWSDPLPITMPYTYNPLLQFLESLFQRFPNLFPILRHLLGY